jgi:hypothetical protein
MARAQASLTAVEAGIGVLVLLAVVFMFALGGQGPTGDRAQLEAYAGDALTQLGTDQPQHGATTRLAEVVASNESFARERPSLVRRVERILPENVMFRVETPYGTAGHPLPDGIPPGAATTTTRHGSVTLRVWYV